MADLVTHVCTALLPGAVFRPRFLPLVVAGTVLPDALGRAVPLFLEQLWLAGLPLPMGLMWAWAGLHEPFGAGLSALVLALAFAEGERKRALLALWSGCWLHTGLDLLQDHHGEGYLLLAPFSERDFELGWIGSEATVTIALPLAILTAIAWIPAAFEAAFGRPTLRPRQLWILAIPVGIALAIGGPRPAAGCAAATLILAAATHRWWIGRGSELVAIAAGGGALVALLLALA